MILPFDRRPTLLPAWCYQNRCYPECTFADGFDDLLDSLADTTADLSEQAIATGEVFTRLVGAQAGDLRTRTSHLASVLAKIILRAYNRVRSAQLRERALEVIDELLANQAYGMDRALEEYESL